MRKNYLNDYRKTSLESEDVAAEKPETAESTPEVSKEETEGKPSETNQPGSDGVAPKDVPEVSKEAPTDGGTGEITSSDEGKTAEGDATGKEAPVEGEAGDIVPSGEGELKPEGGDGKAATANAPTGEIVPTDKGSIEIKTPGVDVDVTEVEFQIMSEAVEQTDKEVSEKQEVEVAKEVLEGYVATLRRLLATETYSVATGRILEQAINNQLRSCNVADTRVSLENHNAPLTVKGRHEAMLDTLVLESNLLNNVAQSFVADFKQGWRSYADYFKGLGAQVNKYGTKLDEAQREFDGKKSTFGNQKHQVSTAIMTEVFSNGQGAVKDVNGALANDLKMSKYVLVDYTAVILQLVGKLTAIANVGNLSTAEGIARVAAAVEALPHPVSLFKKEYIEGKSYLCATTLDIDGSKGREPIDMDGKSLDKLADLATPKRVVEHASFGNKLKARTIGRNTPTDLIKDATGNGAIGMTTEELARLIGFGKEFVKLANHFVSQGNKAEQMGEAMFKALQKLEDTIADGDVSDLADEVFGQINNLATALIWQNYTNPAKAEVKRALRIASTVQIMALRVIYNAGKGSVSNAKADKAPAAAPKAAAPVKK